MDKSSAGAPESCGANLSIPARLARSRTSTQTSFSLISTPYLSSFGHPTEDRPSLMSEADSHSSSASFTQRGTGRYECVRPCRTDSRSPSVRPLLEVTQFQAGQFGSETHPEEVRGLRDRAYRAWNRSQEGLGACGLIDRKPVSETLYCKLQRVAACGLAGLA